MEFEEEQHDKRAVADITSQLKSYGLLGPNDTVLNVAISTELHDHDVHYDLILSDTRG
jgi:hypothetical protein